MRRTGVISLTCIALAMVAAGCNHDGRTLRPAKQDQNATVSTTTTPSTTIAPDLGGLDTQVPGATGLDVSTTGDVAIDDGGASVVTLGSGIVASGLPSAVGPASVLAPWRDGAAIDPRYTCSGTNVSPPLSWSPAPAGTAEIAITLADEQNPTFVHWALAGLDADVTTIEEGTVPEGAIQAVNGSGGTGYTGPCPPAGQTHTYVLTVHYLGNQIELGDGAQGLDMLAAIDAGTIADAQVTGTFTRV